MKGIITEQVIMCTFVVSSYSSYLSGIALERMTKTKQNNSNSV